MLAQIALSSPCWPGLKPRERGHHFKAGSSTSKDLTNIIPPRHIQELDNASRVCLDTCFLGDSRSCTFDS